MIPINIGRVWIFPKKTSQGRELGQVRFQTEAHLFLTPQHSGFCLQNGDRLVQKEGMGCDLIFQSFWSVNLKIHYCGIFSRDKDKPQGSASVTQQEFAEEGTGDSRQ